MPRTSSDQNNGADQPVADNAGSAMDPAARPVARPVVLPDQGGAPAEQDETTSAQASGVAGSSARGRALRAAFKVRTEADEPAMGNLARYLAWVFLALIVGLAIFLSLMIGNNARQVLLNKQYEFAALLSDNLNHQIYRRFTLPTLVGFGRIALRQPAQYERLDLLVRQVIHGMNVQDLRIYDHSEIVSYTITTENLGRDDLASAEVRRAMTAMDPIFRLDSKSSMLAAFFNVNVEPGTFILRTITPLRIENRLGSSPDEGDEGPVMGVLEFTQDITADMISVLQFQRSIIAIILVSCLMIFLIMVVFLGRAERALAARVKEKERLQQQLHQHEKLAGMGRVIAGIAHEIRNPLGIICSSAQLLLRRTKDTDQSSAGILQAIYDESRRLSQTVTDFLDYAKPKTPRHDSVNILNVLQQALVFLGPELDKHGVTLERVCLDARSLPVDEEKCLQAGSADRAEPSDYLVTGDKDLLYRAFYNVLINAVQAMAECNERKINLVLAKREPGADLAGTVPPGTFPAGAVEVLIADSGPGFGSEDLDRFLDPFYTTKPLGSGLGLPIVSSIITSHGGILEIMNKLQDGQNTPAGETGPAANANAAAASGAVVRILLPWGKQA